MENTPMTMVWSRRRGFRAAILVAILAAALSPTLADDDQPPYEVRRWVPRESGPFLGVRVGYLEVEGVDEGSLNLGFVAGYRFASVLGIEGSLDYHRPEFDTYGRATFALQASLVLHPFPPRAPFHPYVLGGVGYYASDYDLDVDGGSGGYAYDDDAGYHAGVGVDIPLGRDPDSDARFELTIDVRYLFTRKDEPFEDRRRDGTLATIGCKVRF